MASIYRFIAVQVDQEAIKVKHRETFSLPFALVSKESRCFLFSNPYPPLGRSEFSYVPRPP